MKRILLVEDETYIRSVYTEVLVEAGFEVVGAEDGIKGFELAKAEAWDLILLDIMLPSLDGTKFLERISELPNKEEKKVIVVSNLDDQVIKDQCYKLGAKSFLVKSNIIPDELVDIVKAHVGTEENKNS